MKKTSPETHSNDFPVGLSQPARRALASAGIKRLDHLVKFSEVELNQLHGLGPKGIDLLRRALGAQGLTFADSPARKAIRREGGKRKDSVKDSHDRFVYLNKLS